MIWVMSKSSRPPPPLEKGEIVDGKYEIGEELGRGGMGYVVTAHHRLVDRKVAIKFLTLDARNEKVVARFEREAQIAARLQSEHAVRVFDVGRLDSGTRYIVMEHLSGVGLDALIAQHGCFEPSAAVDLILQACEPVAEAHARGIIHRDLKPSNLFLAQRDDGAELVKVLDFGISKMTGRGDAEVPNHALTGTAESIGTPGYMSPEQLTSAKDVDERTDVWALGIVLFELLTGRHPFFELGDSLAQLHVSVVTGATPDMDAVPAGLVEAVNGALAKRVAQRHEDVLAFAQAIAPFGGAEAAVCV